jgi:hypothetical protein
VHFKKEVPKMESPKVINELKDSRSPDKNILSSITQRVKSKDSALIDRPRFNFKDSEFAQGKII